MKCAFCYTPGLTRKPFLSGTGLYYANGKRHLCWAVRRELARQANRLAKKAA